LATVAGLEAKAQTCGPLALGPAFLAKVYSKAAEAEMADAQRQRERGPPIYDR
jgi:hypothetical protein